MGAPQRQDHSAWCVKHQRLIEGIYQEWQVLKAEALKNRRIGYRLDDQEFSPAIDLVERLRARGAKTATADGVEFT
jgi:hypothetical protein